MARGEALRRMGGFTKVDVGAIRGIKNMTIAEGEEVKTEGGSNVGIVKDSDHPRKCVPNAFINRGCEVYVSSSTKLHHC